MNWSAPMAGQMAAGAESVLTLFLRNPEDGQTREIPLRFLPMDGRIVVLAPAHPLPQWFAALRASPHARWQIGADTFEGIATEIRDTGSVRARFEATFGPERVSRWLGSREAGVAFETTGPSAPDGRSRVEAYFDRAAADYDHIVEGNPLDRHLREVSLGILRRSFRAGDRVLEIGCGTGLETLPLAAAGIEVVATDVSSRMLERLSSKAAAAGLSEKVHPMHMPLSALAELERECGPASFHGAFSTFGAMNCDPAWAQAAHALARLVAAGGTVVLGVWNRVCLSELAAYGLTGHPRRALARLASPTVADRTRFGLPVYPATVGEYVRAFGAAFEVRAVEGLPVALPPYDLFQHMPNPEVLVPLFAGLDERLRTRFPFNRLGDHFVLVLRRRPGSAGQ